MKGKKNSLKEKLIIWIYFHKSLWICDGKGKKHSLFEYIFISLLKVKSYEFECRKTESCFFHNWKQFGDF